MSTLTEHERLHNNNDMAPAVICKNMDKGRARKPLGERRKAVLRQELMVFLGNTGVLGGGMAVALPSVTLAQLTDDTQTFYLDNDEASWFSSINTMACPLGGLLVGYLMDRIGRKYTILLTDLTGFLGWLLLATAPIHSNRNAIYIQMLTARFLSGIMIGLCVSPVGVYSAEISMPKIRGRLILGTSMGIAFGILFMYLLGYFIRDDWQLIAIISCVYQLLSTICVIPMPETPSWLMQKGHVERARASLKYFRGLRKNEAEFCEEFEIEMAQIKRTAESSAKSADSQSLFQAIKAPEVYKPLLLMIGFFAFQQFSGVVVVIVYAVQIAQRAGMSTDTLLCAVFVGIARVTTTFFMSSIFERFGRRPAGMISAIGMTVCMLLLAASGWYPELKTKMPLLTICCVVLHIVFSTMGLLTLPFFMISEVFPQRVRGSASGLTVSVGLFLSFIVIKFYPDMNDSMGTPNLFAFYGVVSLLAVAYIYFLIPETRGRTLLDIENAFRPAHNTNGNCHKTDLELKEVFIKKVHNSNS